MPRNNSDYQKKNNQNHKILSSLKFKFITSVWLSFDYAFHTRLLISIKNHHGNCIFLFSRPHLKYLVNTQFILDFYIYFADAHNIRHSVFFGK